MKLRLNDKSYILKQKHIIKEQKCIVHLNIVALLRSFLGTIQRKYFIRKYEALYHNNFSILFIFFNLEGEPGELDQVLFAKNGLEINNVF